MGDTDGTASRLGKHGLSGRVLGRAVRVATGLLGHSCTTLYFGLVAALLRSLCFLFDSFCVAFLVTFASFFLALLLLLFSFLLACSKLFVSFLFVFF